MEENKRKIKEGRTNRRQTQTKEKTEEGREKREGQTGDKKALYIGDGRGWGY